MFFTPCFYSGEFMQLGSKEHPDERFNHYLEKTYKKTASLIACCCKAVSLSLLSFPLVLLSPAKLTIQFT